LLQMQEGAPMVSINLSPRINLSSRECDGRAVVALRGELDVADAASVAAAVNAVAVRARELIVDLAGLEFIDSSGLTALLLARKQARKAGGDLLLAGPQDQVLRVLAAIRLAGVFSVHASVGQAAGSAGRSPLMAGPVP
jgi:anti-anti-sigma factor